MPSYSNPFTGPFTGPHTWGAIGHLFEALRADAEPQADWTLDTLCGDNAGLAPRAGISLFDSAEKIIGPPRDLFPKAPTEASGLPPVTDAVAGWLDMLDRLRPFKTKGQIAGVHRYLNGLDGLDEIAETARNLTWTGPLDRFRNGPPSARAALVRYVSLRHLGLHTERLRLVWMTNDGDADDDWIVLAVLLDSRWLVLDHFHGDIVGDGAYPAATPYFSLNSGLCALHWRRTPGIPSAKAADKALNLFAERFRFGRA